jgi:ABC-type methionine transport system permease subunit
MNDKWKSVDFIQFVVLTVMYFCTSIFMALTVAAIVSLYIFYTQHEACIENKLFILINASLCIAMCIMSVLPCIRRSKFSLMS